MKQSCACLAHYSWAPYRFLHLAPAAPSLAPTLWECARPLDIPPSLVMHVAAPTPPGPVTCLHPAPSASFTHTYWHFRLFGYFVALSCSTQCFSNCMGVASAIAVNLTLAAGAGGLTCLFLAAVLGGPPDIGPLLNGGGWGGMQRSGGGGCP